MISQFNSSSLDFLCTWIPKLQEGVGQRDVSECPNAQMLPQDVQGENGNEILGKVSGYQVSSSEVLVLTGTVDKALAGN